MNYPFRTALRSLAFAVAAPPSFQEAMETIARRTTPPSAFYSALNFLGTHDTPSILTVLRAPRDTGDQGGTGGLPPSCRSGHVGLSAPAGCSDSVFPLLAPP